MKKTHILFFEFPLLDKFIFEITYNCSSALVNATYNIDIIQQFLFFLIENSSSFSQNLLQQCYCQLKPLVNQNPALPHWAITYLLAFSCNLQGKGKMTEIDSNPFDLWIVIIELHRCLPEILNTFCEIQDPIFLPDCECRARRTISRSIGRKRPFPKRQDSPG
jgi:hypothetical protein